MKNQELENLDITDPLTHALREEVLMLRAEKAELGEQFEDLRFEHRMLLCDRDNLAKKTTSILVAFV